MYDEAAEYRLLGYILDHPGYVFKINAVLFTGDRRQLFISMREAYIKYGELSSEGIESFYKRSLPGALEAARGVASANALLDKLVNLARKRQLADVAEKAAQLANSDSFTRADVDSIININPITVEEDSSIVNGVSLFAADLHRKIRGQYEFIGTGIPFLETPFGKEYPRKAVTVIGGRRGGGKTAFLIQSALGLARNEHPVLIFSIEMPAERLVSRMAAASTDTNNMDLRTGKVTPQQLEKINEAISDIQTLPIYIIDRTRINVDEMVRQIYIHKELYGIKAVFVDYLQIIAFSGENRSIGWADVCRDLRDAAKELDLAVIMLVQLNDQNGVFWSSEVEQVVDTFVIIEMDQNDIRDEMRNCTFRFSKNRDGPLGNYPAIYEPRYLRYY